MTSQPAGGGREPPDAGEDQGAHAPRSPEAPLRPRDFALLLLAPGDQLPRQRARDQQADRAGLALQRRVLDDLAALDPEPDEMEPGLLQIVEEFGPPTGPTRAIALMLLEEWRAASAAPGWLGLALDEALRGPRSERGPDGR
jgi:hypothetical protein